MIRYTMIPKNLEANGWTRTNKRYSRYFGCAATCIYPTVFNEIPHSNMLDAHRPYHCPLVAIKTRSLANLRSSHGYDPAYRMFQEHI
jgi:hypothetical protein